MANFTGFLDLKSSSELFKKLKWEHDNLVNAKTSTHYQYHAFNFFVTAFHMADWPLRDGTKGNAKLKSEPILKVCGHVANGAKHFETYPNVKAVKSLKKGGYCSGDYAEFGYFESLFIQIDALEVPGFPDTVGVSEFANLVMEFWKNQMQTST